MKQNQNWLVEYPHVEFVHNKSLDFLLPAINIPNEGLKSLPLGFQNVKGGFDILLRMGFKRLVWQVDCLDENYPNSLELIFNPKKEILFSEKTVIFHEFLQKLPNYNSYIDLDVGVGVLVMNIDSKARVVLDCVKRGKYSEIPLSTAQQYYVGFKEGASYTKTEFLIVKKSETLRIAMEKDLDLPEGWLIGLELCEKPREEEEVFNYLNRIRI